MCTYPNCMTRNLVPEFDDLCKSTLPPTLCLYIVTEILNYCYYLIIYSSRYIIPYVRMKCNSKYNTIKGPVQTYSTTQCDFGSGETQLHVGLQYLSEYDWKSLHGSVASHTWLRQNENYHRTKTSLIAFTERICSILLKPRFLLPYHIISANICFNLH